MKDENNKLEFRGGMFMSLVPVAIFFAFCIILFVVFKAFNMEALAMGGFVALLIGGIFCKSYTKFWDSAIRRHPPPSPRFPLSLSFSSSACSPR